MLNETFGGYDVALALAPGSTAQSLLEPNQDLWAQLIEPNAAKLLKELDDDFRPEFVLTTSWWWLMNDESLKETLRRSGLTFVVKSLHKHMTTPKGRRSDIRWNEISAWLRAHPTYLDRWVVLDDELSGTGLNFQESDERRLFVVLCEERRGLTEVEYLQLRTAFLKRSGNNEA